MFIVVTPINDYLEKFLEFSADYKLGNATFDDVEQARIEYNLVVEMYKFR